MATDSKKRLALAIHDFLSQSLRDGTLQAEDADSVEIAQNCIAECFHVDPSDSATMRDAVGGQSLLQIYQVYEKLKGKTTATSEGSSSAQQGQPSAAAATKGAPSEESERLKGQGNGAMQRKSYQEAVDAYTKALELCPLNPIYLSNRAAAFSAKGEHELARNDAELATAADPKYTKAWSRLGLARFALGDAKGSMEAYKKGIDAEGNGGSDAMKKGFETARRRVEEDGGSTSTPDEDVPRSASPPATAAAAAAGGGGGGGPGGMPDLASLAGMLGGGGGAGGGGFDLGSIMQNPMMRSMAQNLMSNPDMMNNLMSNPRVREMAGRFGGGGAGEAGAQGGGGGGGMPDIAGLMQDPAMMEMARNFMGGMGGGGAGRGSGGSS